MKKTDTHKLVAAVLKTERNRSRTSELQFIKAVNDGKYDEVPLAPKPLQSVSTKRQFLKAFKDERLTWWRSLIFLRPHLVKGRMTWVESDDRRVTLDEAAGLLLGFTQTMTMDAKFTDDRESKPLSPKLMGSNLLIAFTDMRGNIEAALQKKDLFADDKRKIGAKDLITWAKEKGFVADEVLAAWVAHNKAEAGEVEQVTAPATPDTYDTGTKSIQRFTAQDKVILETISAKGYDPLKLPENPPGKRGVKAEVHQAIKDNKLFTGGTVFKRAWERLTANGDIVIAKVSP